MKAYRFRRLCYAKLQRIRRWEFWPVWIFYIPIVFYIFYLAIKYRGATLFSITNPKMSYGGIFGDDKANTLLPLRKAHPQAVPKTLMLDGSPEQQLKQIQQSNLPMPLPIVLKPNSGYRGSDVSIIHSQEQCQVYLQQQQGKGLLLQEYIAGKEYGVFYMRQPNKSEGFVYSIVEKTFPEVIGDGQSNLQRLILQHSRACLMAPLFLKQHQAQLEKVLAKNEVYPLVQIGSHCRGSLFLDANHLISEQLSQQLDKLLSDIPEFYFGRLDLRCPSAERLQQGKDLKILEVNGVTSEAAHIYDPKHSLFYAYKVMFKQWDWAFKIGKINQQRGFQPLGLGAIIKRWLQGDKQLSDNKIKEGVKEL